MQPSQNLPMNIGPGPGGLDASAHQMGQSNNAMFPAGLPHSSMSNDALTSALSMLPPELLNSHQQHHLHQSFGQLASSQSGSSASLLSQVHGQLQPGNQPLLGQQSHNPHGGQSQSVPQPQQSQIPSNQSTQHHQQRSQGQQHRSQSRGQPQQQQQLPHPAPTSLSHGNMHVNSQNHQPTPQQQQQPNLAQLLASASAALGPQASLLQQHADIFSDTRASVSNFSASMHDAKQATPADRADIRNLVSILERASKALVSQLDQGVSKLRAIQNSPALSNAAGIFGGAGASSLGQNAGQDLFGGLNNFGIPGMQQQQQQQQQSNPGAMSFGMGMGFPPPSHANGVFGISGNGNANGVGNGFNGSFPNIDLGAQGSGQQGAALSALLAQYLNPSTDPSSRLGALSLFQSLANSNSSNPSINANQGLDGLLNQGLSQQSPSRPGVSGAINQAATQLANGAPLTNAAALAALTSLGITPTMLDALGLGSVAQQMLNAPADAGSGQQDASNTSNQMRTSPGLQDESPDADQNDANTEPARKKRKQGRGKVVGAPPHVVAEVSPSKQSSLPADANKSATTTGRPSLQNGPVKSAPANMGDPSILPNPNISGASGPSETSKRIPTLGVGLRQEGDKRYRNRKLLRDLREHLYRSLGTDEFRKLRNTYKVAEWVPNPHLTEEEKRTLASLPPGAVAQPPITTHIFHVDFTSRDFYRTNQSLIDAIVAEGSKKVEAKPEAYAIVPGTIDRDHLEDVAKDLMDSARSGFRMSLRTGLQAEKEDKEKHEKYRGVERAKTKCRNREIGAGRLRHAIPKQLLIPGAYSDDAASDEDLHGLTKSEWKRQRLRKLRIAKGWEAVTPKWRNKHLTRAYHKADIVSKSKQMARWRRDDPVDLPIPIKLYGKLLPKQLFDPEWLAEHRKELEDEPYCIRINDNDIEGWDESHHPLGEDTSDEMEWSDAKESSMRGRQLMSGSSSRAERESSTRSPASVPSNSAMKAETESKPGSATPAPAPTTGKVSPGTTSSTAAVTSEEASAKKPISASAVSEGSGTSSVSGSSQSGHPDAGDTGGSESDSDVSMSGAPSKVTTSRDEGAQPAAHVDAAVSQIGAETAA